jgi:hypothetical protein
MLPAFLQFSKQDIINTHVAPDPATGLPLLYSKGEQGEWKSCHGFQDIIGVLHGYKPCSIVPRLMLRYIGDAVPKKPFQCSGKKVPGGKKFYVPLLRACDKQGLECFQVSSATLIIHTAATVKQAAALFLIYYGGSHSNDQKIVEKCTAKIMKRYFKPFDFTYVVGMLLGYDHATARSAYHSDILETCLLDQAEDRRMLKKGTPAHEFAVKFVKIYSVWFDEWAEGCRERLDAFLESALVKKTAKEIAAKAHPLSKWAPSQMSDA